MLTGSPDGMESGKIGLKSSCLKVGFQADAVIIFIIQLLD